MFLEGRSHCHLAHTCARTVDFQNTQTDLPSCIPVTHQRRLSELLSSSSKNHPFPTPTEIMSESTRVSIPEGHPFIRTRSGRKNRRRKSGGNRHGTNNTSTGGRPDQGENVTGSRRAARDVHGLSRREADRDLKKVLRSRSFTPVRQVAAAAQPKEVPTDWVPPPSTPSTESCVRGVISVEGYDTDSSSSTVIPPVVDPERSREHRRILYEALGQPISLLYTEERLEDRLRGLPSPLDMPAFVRARVKPLFDDVHLEVLRDRRGGDRGSSVRCWELAGTVVDNVASGRAPDDVPRHHRPQGRPRLTLRMGKR